MATTGVAAAAVGGGGGSENALRVRRCEATGAHTRREGRGDAGLAGRSRPPRRLRFERVRLELADGCGDGADGKDALPTVGHLRAV